MLQQRDSSAMLAGSDGRLEKLLMHECCDEQVVDMFGCSLPVCAARYGCIGELVQEGRNGLLFEDAQQLAQQLLLLLQGFPGKQGQLQHLHSCLQQQPFPRWQQAWGQHVLPVFESLGVCGRSQAGMLQS